MAKAQFSKPASQVDLEERQKKDYVPLTVVRQGEDPVVSDNGYVGVDPVYQNYASETEAPVQAEGGAEAKVFENFVADDADFTAAAADSSDGEENAEEESSTTSTGTSSTPPSSSNPS